MVCFFVLVSAIPALGSDGRPGKRGKPGARAGGPPPVRVLVQPLSRGLIAPDADFTGTIYFRTVSDVAAETNGKVRAVMFEEGRRVKKGSVLVSLSAERLKKDIEAKKASREEVLAKLAKAEKDLKRADVLFEKRLLPEKDHDQYRFTAEGLRGRARALEAEIERLGIELSYKEIRAPFDGVVLEKKVEKGEWVNPGVVVATLADDSIVDLVVNVPQRALPYIRPGLGVEVGLGERRFRARVFSLIPRGDLRTRTFPVKIRLKNRQKGLGQGMEAHVRLPVGKKVRTFLVNRDALTSFMGRTVVFAALDGKAVMIPVKVTGYRGQLVGISAAGPGPGLGPGMAIVIKGNERLRPGQLVIGMKGGKSGGRKKVVGRGRMR